MFGTVVFIVVCLFFCLFCFFWFGLVCLFVIALLFSLFSRFFCLLMLMEVTNSPFDPGANVLLVPAEKSTG